MTSLVTPSAKSHERVKGRWIRDFLVDSKKEWLIYYAKHIVGTSIPWLIAAMACLVFVSRAGVEIAAWGCALLTGIYILIDRVSTNREFSFFRIGGDFFLLGFAIISIIGAAMSESVAVGMATLGGARWVLMLYLLTYCWELFPGLNRIFGLLVGTASIVAVYGIWQHFTGVDLIRGAALPYAPTPQHAYFSIIGFCNTPEIFGTLMAAIIPFPAAAFLLSDDDEGPKRWMAFFIVLLLGLVIFWTYRPGLWLATGAGLMVTILMKGRHLISFLLALIAFFSAVLLVSYGSVDLMLADVQKAELARAERQRAQINTEVQLWQENTWVGVGHKATAAASYDPSTGNVYFQILAQSGVLGLSFYLIFVLACLLSTYRIFQEIPPTHYWHRILISGGLAAQIAFHTAGLYWSTLAEAFAVNLFVLLLSAIAYLSEHYQRGLVPDDSAL